MVLTHYAPHVSGLTSAAREMAEGLAGRGRRVTVVTGRHDRSLPAEEMINGVRVRRAPVLTPLALRAARTAKVLNLQLPMPSAGIIARRARCPVVLTYHRDGSLPPGWLNSLRRKVIDGSSRAAMAAARTVVVSSADYARHSRLWSAIEPGMAEVPPPYPSLRAGRPGFRDGTGPQVGFLGRIVEEKGLEYLVDGFRALPDPSARLLIGGDFVAGGRVAGRVLDRIGGDPRIRMLGFVPQDRLADFYASLDVFALPSVNAFEAFGTAQVHAMRAEPPDRRAGAAAARRLGDVADVLDCYEELFDRATAGRPASYLSVTTDSKD